MKTKRTSFFLRSFFLKNKKIIVVSPHPDDETVLSQGSLFSARIFLAKQKERQLVCALVTNSISMEEFVNSADITTKNCKMIKTVVERLKHNHETLPDHYKSFLNYRQ